mgnify:CR=1 FL=1
MYAFTSIVKNGKKTQKTTKNTQKRAKNDVFLIKSIKMLEFSIFVKYSKINASQGFWYAFASMIKKCIFCAKKMQL